MEHPLRVEELSPAEAAQPVAVERPVLGAQPPGPATPLPPLPSLPASDVLFLKPSDAHYADYLAAANIRTQLSPSLRAVCKTEHAVAVMVDWVRTNNLSFAVRCGGHSYEGFSQSKDVVIDLRGLGTIAVDKAAGVVTLGCGVSLFAIYQALAAQGLALQAGSCPTVGISGHILGGGHGLLARSHGLTCDSLQQATIIDAQAQTLQANATSNPDLYWACRGGGGGSFGIATQFTLSAFPLKSALVFGVSWTLSQARAARIFAAWQAWAPNAPSTITSIMKVGPAGNGLISMRCIGQSVGTEAELRHQLGTFVGLEAQSKPLAVQSLGFLDAVKHFAGPLGYQSVLHESQVRLRADPARSRRDPGHAGNRRRRAGRRHRPAVRLLWRPDLRRRGGRDGLPAAERHPVLHPILLGVGARSRYAYASRDCRKSLRRDAAVHARRLIRELLRSRSAELGECLLGRKSRAPERDEEAVRSGECVSSCAEA